MKIISKLALVVLVVVVTALSVWASGVSNPGYLQITVNVASNGVITLNSALLNGNDAGGISITNLADAATQQGAVTYKQLTNGTAIIINAIATNTPALSTVLAVGRNANAISITNLADASTPQGAASWFQTTNLVTATSNTLAIVAAGKLATNSGTSLQFQDVPNGTNWVVSIVSNEFMWISGNTTNHFYGSIK